MATRPKAIQNEILPTNPCVEHFTHISPYILKSVGLTARQLAFLAFVVAPVELIYDEVLDVFKMFLQRLVPMNMSFKMTRVIVDDGIGVDFFHLHGCPNYLHLVWRTFVDQMLLCC